MNGKVQQDDSIEAPEFKSNSLSGRASWDARGNSVWEWQTAPGVYSQDINTQKLRSLQASELQLLDSEPSRPHQHADKRMSAHKLAPERRRESELILPARRKTAL